ncbi:MAG: shikimate dehydrogenase [Bacteroidales bacterium]|jgi:shikimate dehydrogenase|nr:shikimate dehydrogenase [Bacteroidales bacterium]
MKLYGLVGNSLAHSSSKEYFERKFADEGITDVAFSNFELATLDYLPVILDNFPNLEGLTVTIPYKSTIIPFMTKITDEVKEIRALNVVKVKRLENSVRLSGYNTDVYGFEKSLLQSIRSSHDRALVLGAGGAGKAVGYVLDKLGIQHKFVTRGSKIGALGYEDLSEDMISSYPLIVNATSLGMFPNVDTFPPIPYGGISDKHFLFDLIYNPEMSIFLERGRQQGAFTKNGYEMFCFQAEEAWRIWNE